MRVPQTQRHREALQLLITRTDGISRSEQYCLKHGGVGSDEQEPMLLLVQLLCEPQDPGCVRSRRQLGVVLSCPPGLTATPTCSRARACSVYEARLDSAIRLLRRHSLRINPLLVLDVIPDSTPLTDLRQYIEQVRRVWLALPTCTPQRAALRRAADDPALPTPLPAVPHH